MKMIKRAKCGRCRKSYSRDDGYHEQASIQACLRSRNSILCLRNKLFFNGCFGVFVKHEFKRNYRKSPLRGRR